MTSLAIGSLFAAAGESPSLRLTAATAAILTAYGLQLVQQRQEIDNNTGTGVSLQSLTGVTTSYRLEPPLHQLVCLCDLRIQQQQQQQQRMWRSSSNSSSSWYIGYATSRQLTASGAARGLRDNLSNFRRCSSSSSSSSNDQLDYLQQQQQRVLLQHPLYGVSDAACRLCIEMQRILIGTSGGYSLAAAVLSLWGVAVNRPVLLPAAAAAAAADTPQNRSNIYRNSKREGSGSSSSKLMQSKPQQLTPLAAAYAGLSRDEFFRAQRAVAAAVATEALIRRKIVVAPQMEVSKGFRFKTDDKAAAAAAAATAAAAAAAAADAAADVSTPKRKETTNSLGSLNKGDPLSSSSSAPAATTKAAAAATKAAAAAEEGVF
ncbi:hypothetical protein, conserved [Eimeria maxima]|uniref:Uncharacterized protein n=1 Tax=Eimeria maxima TaxID=5804 RepID=U6LXD3_EIMMA|nr:hypothetical protein, conserved [Eimeria maxima]CDJ56602.1 hypothetical protein, conserved [Eimeria maxima]